jgi:hypothetical protein
MQVLFLVGQTDKNVGVSSHYASDPSGVVPKRAKSAYR